MVETVDILNAINGELIKAFPDRTVYVDVCPVKFVRPSFWIQFISMDMRPASAQSIEVSAYFTITCIDQVDEYYHTKTRRLLQDQMAVINLFRIGFLQVGDRALSIKANSGGRDNDMAFTELQLEFLDDRLDREPEREPMNDLEIKINQRRDSFGTSKH